MVVVFFTYDKFVMLVKKLIQAYRRFLNYNDVLNLYGVGVLVTKLCFRGITLYITYSIMHTVGAGF